MSWSCHVVSWYDTEWSCRETTQIDSSRDTEWSCRETTLSETRHRSTSTKSIDVSCRETTQSVTTTTGHIVSCRVVSFHDTEFVSRRHWVIVPRDTDRLRGTIDVERRRRLRWRRVVSCRVVSCRVVSCNDTEWSCRYTTQIDRETTSRDTEFVSRRHRVRFTTTIVSWSLYETLSDRYTRHWV